MSGPSRRSSRITIYWRVWLVIVALMETEILEILKQAPGMRFSCKEIGRIVDRSVFRENPNWARPILEKLVADRRIWNDEGYYLYPTEKRKAHQIVTPEKAKSDALPRRRFSQ